jgi:hypothetical protein
LGKAMDDAEQSDEFSVPITLGGSAANLVVRAWLEPGPSGEPVLRGTVAVLGGRMLGAFDSLERLVALVEIHLASKNQ